MSKFAVCRGETIVAEFDTPQEAETWAKKLDAIMGCGMDSWDEFIDCDDESRPREKYEVYSDTVGDMTGDFLTWTNSLDDALYLAKQRIPLGTTILKMPGNEVVHHIPPQKAD